MPLQEVQRRDPKGLYKQVEEGKIKSFTGVSEDAPYEAPINAGEEEQMYIRIVYLPYGGKETVFFVFALGWWWWWCFLWW